MDTLFKRVPVESNNTKIEIRVKFDLKFPHNCLSFRTFIKKYNQLPDRLGRDPESILHGSQIKSGMTTRAASSYEFRND